jgi:hypothetical protein
VLLVAKKQKCTCIFAIASFAVASFASRSKDLLLLLLSCTALKAFSHSLQAMVGSVRIRSYLNLQKPALFWPYVFVNATLMN